ncbi:hypothetical protein GQ53DRAFT_743008 [Thozetella sp. PMI_491]|nr:hypothetical protein GQ53DRAFT_743008 [Thozetella sp. PMI_491]
MAPLAAWAAPIVLREAVPLAIQRNHDPSFSPPTKLPQLRYEVSAVSATAEDTEVKIRFDNKPVTPSTGSTPEEVLSLPRPIATSYLLFLAAADKAHKSTVGLLQETVLVSSESSVVGAETRPQATSPYNFYVPRTPCPTRASQEHNARLITWMVAAFICIVVLLESWEVIYSRARSILAPRGAIRLEEKERTQGPSPLPTVVKDIRGIRDTDTTLEKSELE